MGSSPSSSNVVAARYAVALIDAASESGAVDAVEKDINALDAMIAGSADLQAVLRSPVLKRAQQQAAFSALAERAGFHDLSRNFLLLLAANRRVSFLPSVIQAIREDLARRRGEVRARVRTASVLSEAQTAALQESLSAAAGQSVILEVVEDRSLLGGMVVTVGSKMVDDSVKRKLERLSRAMQAGANQNLGAGERAS